MGPSFKSPYESLSQGETVEVCINVAISTTQTPGPTLLHIKPWKGLVNNPYHYGLLDLKGTLIYP